MPDSFDDAFPGGFEECVRTLTQEDSVDDPEKLCGWLQENGFEAIQSENPTDVLASLEVEYVSVVDEPAQDSEWLVAKSAAADPEAFDPAEPSLRDGEFVVNKQSEDPERKVWAAVLIPDETDKQGDLVPRPEIERAAHNYLKHYRKVDEDHDLVDGSGEPIESYVLKQETAFDMPDGSGERTYPAGTWIMGVELTDEAWKRVESGELSGFSIYGGAASLEPGELLTPKQKDILQNMQANKNEDEQVEKQPEDDPCWDGYVMVGFKTDEFGNEVPNCVPEEDAEAMSSVAASVGTDEDLSDETLQAGATALSAVVGKELSPADLNDAVDEYQDQSGEDADDAGLVAFVEWAEDYYSSETSDGEDEEPESDGMDGDDEQESSKESGTAGNGGDPDGGSDPEREKDTMGDDNSDDETEEQNEKLDELLEKMNSTQESVEETRKGVESVRDRVDDLEQEVFEKEEGGDDPDHDDDTLDEETVEEVAQDAAEKGVEKALRDAFEVPEDEEGDLSEVVRKGEKFPDPDHDGDDEQDLELDYSGVVAGEEA